MTLPTECFLCPVGTDNAYPTMAPVCVWYMEVFVTLGGILSVCLTVTLCKCCWERVAIGASLLPSCASPLPRYSTVSLPSCVSSLRPFLHASLCCFLCFLHSVIPLPCFSYLPWLAISHESVTPFNASSSSPTLQLPFLDRYFSSSSPFIFTFHTRTDTLKLSVGFELLRSSRDLWLQTGTWVEGWLKERRGRQWAVESWARGGASWRGLGPEPDRQWNVTPNPVSPTVIAVLCVCLCVCLFVWQLCVCVWLGVHSVRSSQPAEAAVETDRDRGTEQYIANTTECWVVWDWDICFWEEIWQVRVFEMYVCLLRVFYA